MARYEPTGKTDKQGRRIKRSDDDAPIVNINDVGIDIEQSDIKITDTGAVIFKNGGIVVRAAILGTGAPTPDIGENSQFYVDETTQALYIKEDGAWQTVRTDGIEGRFLARFYTSVANGADAPATPTVTANFTDGAFTSLNLPSGWTSEIPTQDRLTHDIYFSQAYVIPLSGTVGTVSTPFLLDSEAGIQGNRGFYTAKMYSVSKTKPTTRPADGSGTLDMVGGRFTAFPDGYHSLDSALNLVSETNPIVWEYQTVIDPALDYSSSANNWTFSEAIPVSVDLTTGTISQRDTTVFMHPNYFNNQPVTSLTATINSIRGGLAGFDNSPVNPDSGARWTNSNLVGYTVETITDYHNSDTEISAIVITLNDFDIYDYDKLEVRHSASLEGVDAPFFVRLSWIKPRPDLALPLWLERDHLTGTARDTVVGATTSEVTVDGRTVTQSKIYIGQTGNLQEFVPIIYALRSEVQGLKGDDGEGAEILPFNATTTYANRDIFIYGADDENHLFYVLNATSFNTNKGTFNDTTYKTFINTPANRTGSLSLIAQTNRSIYEYPRTFSNSITLVNGDYVIYDDKLFKYIGDNIEINNANALTTNRPNATSANWELALSADLSTITSRVTANEGQIGQLATRVNDFIAEGGNPNESGLIFRNLLTQPKSEVGTYQLTKNISNLSQLVVVVDQPVHEASANPFGVSAQDSLYNFSSYAIYMSTVVGDDVVFADSRTSGDIKSVAKSMLLSGTTNPTLTTVLSESELRTATGVVGFDLFQGGMCYDPTDNTLYVSSSRNFGTVYAINPTTKLGDSTKNITLDTTNDFSGIARNAKTSMCVNDTTIYMYNPNTEHAIAYNRSTKARESSKDLDFSSFATGSFTSIECDNEIMWVIEEDYVRVYNLSTKARDTSKEPDNQNLFERVDGSGYILNEVCADDSNFYAFARYGVGTEYTVYSKPSVTIHGDIQSEVILPPYRMTDGSYRIGSDTVIAGVTTPVMVYNFASNNEIEIESIDENHELLGVYEVLVQTTVDLSGIRTEINQIESKLIDTQFNMETYYNQVTGITINGVGGSNTESYVVIDGDQRELFSVGDVLSVSATPATGETDTIVRTELSGTGSSIDTRVWIGRPTATGIFTTAPSAIYKQMMRVDLENDDIVKYDSTLSKWINSQELALATAKTSLNEHRINALQDLLETQQSQTGTRLLATTGVAGSDFYPNPGVTFSGTRAVGDADDFGTFSNATFTHNDISYTLGGVYVANNSNTIDIVFKRTDNQVVSPNILNDYSVFIGSENQGSVILALDGHSPSQSGTPSYASPWTRLRFINKLNGLHLDQLRTYLASGNTYSFAIQTSDYHFFGRTFALPITATRATTTGGAGQSSISFTLPTPATNYNTFSFSIGFIPSARDTTNRAVISPVVINRAQLTAGYDVPIYLADGTSVDLARITLSGETIGITSEFSGTSGFRIVSNTLTIS